MPPKETPPLRTLPPTTFKTPSRREIIPEQALCINSPARFSGAGLFPIPPNGDKTRHGDEPPDEIRKRKYNIRGKTAIPSA